MTNTAKSDLNEALVMGGCPTGLAAIRNLGRHGVPVWVIDPVPHAQGFYSKYARTLGTFRSPADDERLLSSLLGWAEDRPRKPVLFPTSDVYLDFVGRNADNLRDHFLFYRLDQDVCETFLDKKKFYRLCSSLNVSIPITVFPENESDWRNAADRMKYPCIVKPICTHVWDEVYKGLKAFVITDAGDLLHKYEQLSANDLASNVMVQEIIPGPEDRILLFAAYFDRESVAHSTFTGRKVRQFPPNFGTAAMVSPEPNDSVKEAAVSFLAKVNFNGVCDVEFKLDERDGTIKMIEINPRVGRWFSVAEGCGLHIPYVAYRDIVGLPLGGEEIQGAGRTWIYASKDLLSAVRHLTRGQLPVRQWVLAWLRPKIWAVYAPDDRKPFFFSGLSFLLKLKKYFVNRMRQKRRASSADHTAKKQHQV
jgi:predicted ATP-grasp superfamily ATP-dependent carboligase